MYPRLAAARLRALAAAFPAVLILGARQVGKTTLARRAFPELPYVDLEDPRTREVFQEEPRFQVEQRTTRGIVLDEAQRVPELFPALRGVIDADRGARGRFILLGSAQPTLVRGVSESLAGRVGLLELAPLTCAEVAAGEPEESWQRVWLRGGFPDALSGPPREWHEAYLRTYVERDLPALGLQAEPVLVRRLLTMLAHQQGGLLNVSALASSLGVGQGVVARALDVFEQTFLVRRLPPYYRNVGKRLTKHPKCYLRDTGLLHHLLNITTLEELQSHPVRGASFETLVLEDIIRRESLDRPHTQPFFWRTAAGAEIDLVLDRGDRLAAVEIKAGVGNARHARHLRDALGDLGLESATLLDQGGTEEPLNAQVSRRGWGGSLSWLPTPGSG